MNGELDLFAAFLTYLMLGCVLFLVAGAITVLVIGDVELKMPRHLSDVWNRAKFLGQRHEGSSVVESGRRPFHGPMGPSRLPSFIETLRYELRLRVSAVEIAPAGAVVSTYYHLPASVVITDAEFERLVDIVDIEAEVTMRLAVAAANNFRKIRIFPLVESLRIHNVVLSSHRGVSSATIEANIIYSIVPDPVTEANSETISRFDDESASSLSFSYSGTYYPERLMPGGKDAKHPSSRKETPKRTGRLLAIYGEKDV